MALPPLPQYEYDVEQLVRLYQQAIDKILIDLNRMDLSEFNRANQLALLKSISETLSELNTEAGLLATQVIDKAVKDGILYTIMSLGVAESVQEAEKIMTFNRMNRELNKAIVADLQTDLLEVTNNVNKKVRSAVRQVSSEVMRNNVTQGINGTQTLKREILKGLREKLGESVETGIIDVAGRHWKPTTYVDMLVRTKMMEAHKESTINEALNRNVLYGVISSHGAKDACRNWEGRVIKLTRDAEGDYPYIGDLPRKQIFHPNCKHVISPLRRPERA